MRRMASVPALIVTLPARLAMLGSLVGLLATDAMPVKLSAVVAGPSITIDPAVTVTLPAAMPGILTGLILSMSRAAGETAPVLFTAAVAMGPVPTSLSQPTRTLSYSSYDMAVGDKMAMLAPHNQFGMVMTLVAIVLLLNVVAIVIRGRISRKLRGQ